VPARSSPPAKTRRLSREERRAQIVAAALRVFSQRGFRGATTRELARAAGVTEVTLFRHFPTKEQLFAAVIDTYSILPVVRSELLEHAGGGDDARATLHRIGRKFLAILRERQDLIRLMLSEAVHNPRQARVLFRQGPGRFIQDMKQLLEAFRARGAIRDVNLGIAARAILGVFYTHVMMQDVLPGREGEAFDLDEAADALTDLLWRGLRPEAGAKGGKRK